MHKRDKLQLITNSFQQLHQVGFDLGIGELLAAFKAMEGGWGEDKKQLVQTLKLLWCKSLEDRYRFDSIWETTILTHAERKQKSNKKLLKTPSHNIPAGSYIDENDEGKDNNDKELTNSTSSSKLAPLPVHIPLATIKLEKLEADFPISQVQMLYAWRYLRHPVPDGKEIVDIDCTIKQTVHQGFFIAPSYRRSIQNHAHLLLIIDQEGSMTPFHPFARDIVNTVQKSSIKVETFYFHNTPVEYLYQDAHRQQPIEIQEIFNKCSKNTSALIISDAGAARGYKQLERIQETSEFLFELQIYIQHIAWLNPMPKERWLGTSAAVISYLVPMFEINANGFRGAINFLQGIY